MSAESNTYSSSSSSSDFYGEYAPCPDLAPWIERLWLRARSIGPTRAEGLRVLPDGRAHLLVDLSCPAEPDAIVVGPRRTALVVPCQAWTRVLGVRFRAGAARGLLGVPLADITDRRIAFSDIHGDAASVGERLAEADQAGGLFAALERELLAWRARAERPEPRVRSIVARLQQEPDAMPIQALAAEVGITRQHLARLFREEVGYGPKTLARVLRLQRAIHLLRRGRDRSLAAVALDAGYYDQPHMNAEFRVLAGIAPTRLAV